MLPNSKKLLTSKPITYLHASLSLHLHQLAIDEEQQRKPLDHLAQSKILSMIFIYDLNIYVIISSNC